ncbi:MAG: YlbF family regulator [Bacilli bacterium]|nr:YlbF family regulator [Bacilli bacterium]
MEERFQKKLEEYQEEFINSDEYKNLKELDLKLEKDEELLKLVKIKKDIEDKLSSNYLISSDSERENLLKEYKKINDEINKLPIVIEYNNAYNKIKRIKNIFEDELLRKLV